MVVAGVCDRFGLAERQLMMKRSKNNWGAVLLNGWRTQWTLWHNQCWWTHFTNLPFADDINVLAGSEELARLVTNLDQTALS